MSTCRFAQRVALVRNEVSVNLERDLNEENRLLRQEIYQLQNKCANLKAKVRTNIIKFSYMMNSLLRLQIYYTYIKTV